MSSIKQLRANRANATKSTGPKTGEGKARSRLNSWKHGLTATLLPGECAREFEALGADLMEEHAPQSATQAELVTIFATTLLRLRRAPAFEAAIVKARKAQLVPSLKAFLSTVRLPGEDEAQDGEVLPDNALSEEIGRALIEDAAKGDALGKLVRHERHLMNTLVKTLQMLLLRGSRDQEEVMT
jgi:hypothetical protein